MRQWRVGTLTMGLLLVFLGIVLMFAQIKDLSVIDFFIKWWPILFILLGLEVLAYSFFLKKDQERIRYDIFSIFMVLIIVGSGLVLQAFNDFDISKQIRQMVVSQNFNMQTEVSELPLDATIKKIVVEAPECGLRIKTSPSDSIEAYGTAYVVADNMDKAKEILNASTKVVTHRTGDTLNVSFITSDRNGMAYGATLESYSLVLPEKIAVEIHNSYSSLEIEATISADWKVNSDGPVEISLPVGSNAGINAWAASPDLLQGNVKWTVEDQATQDENGPCRVHGKTQTGQPLNTINIVSEQSIMINQS